jgi:hypothetical protein
MRRLANFDTAAARQDFRDNAEDTMIDIGIGLWLFPWLWHHHHHCH